GRVRAERSPPVEARDAYDQLVPVAPVAERGAHGRDAGEGVLRQVRRGDEPAGGGGRRPAHRRDRPRPRQARGIRHLPYWPNGFGGRRFGVVGRKYGEAWRPAGKLASTFVVLRG